MSGETLEDYFRHLNPDATRRKFLDGMKEGKQEDKGIEQHYFKNGSSEEYSPVVQELVGLHG
jgi:hypothetical protein